MEEIIKGLIELAKVNRETGLLCIVFLLVVWFLIKLLVKQVKWREEWLEKFVTVMQHNAKVMGDGTAALKDTQNTVAEMDTDLHDVLSKMEIDREVKAELERRGHGRGNR